MSVTIINRFSMLLSDLNCLHFFQIIKGRSISTTASAWQTGILMLNMGGPQTIEKVKPFLTRLFLDRDIIKIPIQSKLGPLIAKMRTSKVEEKYRQIGGGSPIKNWTDIQGKNMINILDKISRETAPHLYYIGFRYTEPLIEEALDKMERDGIKRAIAFSQYPQYSCNTSGSSFNAISSYYIKRKTEIIWSFIDRWPINSGLIEAFRDLTLKEIKKFPKNTENIVILFSAHALPLSAVNKGDPYPTEVASTTIKVMESLNWAYPYRLVWQSKVGPVPWLRPQIEEAIKGYAALNYKNFVIVPISFINEHIETLHELDIEYGKELAKKLKVNIRRVSAPNDHPAFIQGLADIVKSHLLSNQVCSKQLLLRCPLCKNPICKQVRDWILTLKLK